VHLRPNSLAGLTPRRSVSIGAALFVCTGNSARSQLAAALWEDMTGAPAISAGTHPASKVHPGAVAAARRRGLDLGDSVPRGLESIGSLPPLVVTVCDRAHEELGAGEGWLHWSVPDPVAVGTKAAFEATVVELSDRIRAAVAPAS